MNKRVLTEEIQWELSQLKRLAEMARALAGIPESRRDPWDPTAASKYVSDVFRGLVNLCKRRAVYLNAPWPTGPDSHARVLNDFLNDPALGGRLSLDMADRLRSYKAFRHRFIHGYGFELAWDTVDEPLRLVPETVETLTAIWEHWLSELPEDTRDTRR